MENIIKNLDSGEAVVTTTNVGMLVNFLMNLDSKPSNVTKDAFEFVDCEKYLDIVMFGNYHIELYYQKSDSIHDCAYEEYGGPYHKEDLKYAMEIIENRSAIILLWKALLFAESNF